jgi:hypothetical protein
MDSVVLCFAAGDEAFARCLADFLEVNLPLVASCRDAVVGPDLDLLEAAERALSAEVALILLSPLSVPRVWNRKTWEPVFLEKPKEFQTQLGFVLLSECKFPEVFRRTHFFDASGDALSAARQIKRWLLRPMAQPGPMVRIAGRISRRFTASIALVVAAPGWREILAARSVWLCRAHSKRTSKGSDNGA